jgi:hypothetical protein
MLFDWLVTGGILASNPATSVRGPKHVIKRGKTPVLTADQAALRRCRWAELSEATVHTALLMAADMIEMLAAEAAAAAWKKEQERRRGSLLSADRTSSAI